MQQFGHGGSHHGDGSPGCPRDLHHHHDERCEAPMDRDDEALKHFVRRSMGYMTGRCELTADKPDHGRCPRPAAAVCLEDSFSDIVCEEHAASAEARGAQVLRP